MDWRGRIHSAGGGVRLLVERPASRGVAALVVVALALALALTGCKPRTRLELHYLPGFVPGSQNVFAPAKIAVLPTTGNFGAGVSEVGAIYAPDGTVMTPLAVSDAAGAFNRALIQALGDAGLAPVALSSNPAGGRPPEGSDFILSSELERLEVNKRLGANWTIHGQYFTMSAVVRARFELRSRDGALLYSGEISGLEDEPPSPVGAEVFLPLETEPAESLSVALSRAVGTLMVQPAYRDALPRRAAEATPASTATPHR
jgi:hypothetical protein